MRSAPSSLAKLALPIVLATSAGCNMKPFLPDGYRELRDLSDGVQQKVDFAVEPPDMARDPDLAPPSDLAAPPTSLELAAKDCFSCTAQITKILDTNSSNPDEICAATLECLKCTTPIINDPKYAPSADNRKLVANVSNFGPVLTQPTRNGQDSMMQVGWDENKTNAAPDGGSGTYDYNKGFATNLYPSQNIGGMSFTYNSNPKPGNNDPVFLFNMDDGQAAYNWSANIASFGRASVSMGAPLGVTDAGKPKNNNMQSQLVACPDNYFDAELVKLNAAIQARKQ